MSEGIIIYLWPDGTWVTVDDYRECDWTHMSDDKCRISHLALNDKLRAEIEEAY